MKTSMGIVMEKVGFLIFFPPGWLMTNARMPKSPCDLFIRVEGTLCFQFFIFVDTSPFPMVVVSKHSEEWPRKIELQRKILTGRLRFSVLLLFVLACDCPNLVKYHQFERVKCEIESEKMDFFMFRSYSIGC